jgi:hypothetical protein
MARPAIKRSADYVTVACKLPTGLKIPVQGLAQPIHLHGSHSPYNRFGYGMTEVKADIWAQIRTQYGPREGTDRNGDKCMIPEAAWLANGVVFAASDTRSVNAEAKETEGLIVGFEPIDPNKPHTAPGVSRAIQLEGLDDPGAPGLN